MIWVRRSGDGWAVSAWLPVPPMWWQWTAWLAGAISEEGGR